MKKTTGFSFYHLFVISISLILLGSCVSQKQVKYFQQVQTQNAPSAFQNTRTSDYKIQAHDNLYIKVYGLDEKSFLFFNKQSGINPNYSTEQTEIGLYLDSYVVNDSGYIDFPLAGKIFVKDLKVEEAKARIQTVVNEYLKNVLVTVKMVNFQLNILGEVRKPGNYTINQDKINIFEAISLAGDLNEFANRHKVALVRQTKEGSKVVYLNLNSIEILSSPYYYLEPNDILYFAPLGVKRFGTETFPWALVFSAITTTLLLISYLKL
jgi:polysaccharide export outer membrane protein